MAVAYESAAADGSAFSETATVSITPSGSDRILIASVGWGTDSTGKTVSSVVFNGSENFTRIGGIDSSTGTDIAVDLWYLLNPTATTANVVATISAAPSAGTVLGVMAFSGAGGVSGLQTTEGIVSPDGQPSVTVTSAVGDMVIDALVCEDSGLIPGADQTERYEHVEVGATTLAGSTEAGASSVTMSYSDVGTFNKYVYAAVNITAAVAAPTNVYVPGTSQRNRRHSGRYL
jgi:hypothetical protein